MEPTPAVQTAADLDDLLAAFPAGGALVGYARVSTRDQRLDRQEAALKAAGCLRVFADKLSGKTADRPELAAAMDYLRPGDTLVVPSLDRLSRSLQDLITIVADLRRRGVGFRSLKESLDTTTAGGRLVFHVFAALAEFIRELIVEGTNEGLAAARARGVTLGRPPAMTPEQVSAARDMLTNPKQSVSSIARLLGVHRSTIYKHLPELSTHGRKALISGVGDPVDHPDATAAEEIVVRPEISTGRRKGRWETEEQFHARLRGEELLIRSADTSLLGLTDPFALPIATPSAGDGQDVDELDAGERA